MIRWLFVECLFPMIMGFALGVIVMIFMIDEIIVKRFDRNIKRINSQIKDKSLLEHNRDYRRKYEE